MPDTPELNVSYPDMLAWAESKEQEDPDQTIGWRQNPFRCPLCRYLKLRHPTAAWMVSFHPRCDKQEAYASRRGENGPVNYRLPDWCYLLITRIDNHPQVTQPGYLFPRPVIRAGDLVRLLHSLTF